MDGETRRATLAEIDRALGELHAGIHEAMRERDDDLYRTLTRRYERLRQRRESLRPPQVGPNR
jgi:hypothetical protein